jgi:amino acid transporter
MSLLASKTRSPSSSTASPGLRLHVLGFPTLLAQSIALISPTMTAVLIIPLAFSDAGQGTWLAYIFGTVMLMFVVLNLNQFAKRSTSAGSMYSYTARGLGPAAGVASGWTLLWCYLFIGIAGLTGFAVFSQQFLSAIGASFTVPPIIFFLISAVACWFVAFKDIRISSLLTLALEGLSVACILSLAAVVLFKHGFVDTSQVKLTGVGLHGMSLAVVACIFSLVGFESATALGSEAKDPLRTVPRAVVWSLILTGSFMVIMAYVEVAGTAHLPTSLAVMGAPLITLSKAYHVSAFRVPISLGAMVSFYGLTLSCLNAGSRILYPMAEHAVMPRALSRAHHRNQTPHVAITAYILVMVSVPMILEINHNPLTIFDDAGTLAAFGFLLAYFLITVAAPVYLKRIGELKRSHVVLAVVAFAALLVPTEGSFYPLPPYPVRLFPYMFAGYLVLGGLWLSVVRKRNPQVLAEIAADLASTPAVPVAGAVLTMPEAPSFATGQLASETA